VNEKRNHIVVLGEPQDVTSGVAVHAVEVADHDHEVIVRGDPAGLLEDAVQHSRCGLQWRVRAQGLVLLRDRLEDSHDCVAAALGADLHHVLVVEDERADAIAHGFDAPRTERCELGCGDGLQVLARTVEHRNPLVHQQ